MRRRRGCHGIERSRPSIAETQRLRRDRTESAVDRSDAATGSRRVGRRRLGTNRPRSEIWLF